jgi:hypothetical protein
MLRRVAAAAFVLLAPLALVACTASVEDSTSSNPSSAGEPSEEGQLIQAVAQLYPGFEIMEFLGRQEGVYYVTVRRDTVPEFVARLGFIKGSDWNESVTVEGTQWSTDGYLSEAASDSSLLTGSLQTQILESIAADAGLVGGSDGRYVHELRTVSNVEMTALVLEPDGQHSTYTYKLDMRQSPHRFVLESKTENR